LNGFFLLGQFRPDSFKFTGVLFTGVLGSLFG
jgi:hypothetical protein